MIRFVLSRIKRILIIFSGGLALTLVFSLQSCSDDDGPFGRYDLKFIKSFESGSYYLSPGGIYPILDLYGDWHAMGRQYGYLLREKLRSFHEEITVDLVERGISYAEQVDAAKGVASLYSPEIKSIMAGMSETSGLSENEVMVLNAGMMFLASAIISGDSPSECSGIAAWGQYSPEGTLVFGRNWDINRKAMLKYMKYLGIVVFHPAEDLAVANIHPVGNLYLETGMNEKGLFLELNNGEQSDGNYDPDAEDTSSVLLRVLASASTMDEAYSLLCDTPADLSYIIQIADASRAISVERPTFGCRVKEGRHEGVLAAYNSFVPPYPPDWEGLVNPPPPVQNDPRLENLYNLADSPEYKGFLDVNRMMALMDISVEDGGAVHAGTVVQVIAVPDTRTVWLRGLEYSDWEKVELWRLF